MARITKRVLEPPPALDGAPGWLVALVARMLAREPSARPTATEVTVALSD